GPDGKPLAGARMTSMGLIRHWIPEPLKGAEFTVKGLKPGESQRVLFLHKEKGLAGTLLIGSDERGPVTVNLQPWGVVSGRLLNAEGKPRRDVQMESRDYIVESSEGVKPQPLDAGSLPGSVKPIRMAGFLSRDWCPD